jgi:hypothetical protein
MEIKLPVNMEKIQTMKSLLTITGLIEGVTGLAFAVVPSLLVSLLLGTSLTDPGAILISRLTGVALSTIAAACLLSSTNTGSFVMVKVMLGYNTLAMTLLVYAVLFEKISGPGLWPAVLVHFGLMVWSVSSLFRYHLIRREPNIKAGDKLNAAMK